MKNTPLVDNQSIEDLYNKLSTHSIELNELSELNLFYQKISEILLAEAKELNSGVMEKDGTVWHNLN